MDGHAWQVDYYIAHAIEQGWRSADYPNQASWRHASRPNNGSGQSLPWRAGFLWDRCPAYHARRSPYVPAARSLLAHVRALRLSVSSPPPWTPAGARLAVMAEQLYRDLDDDQRATAIKAAAKKGNKPGR